MTPIPRVSKTDSVDLAFAWSCLLSGAITFDEFRAWAEHVVTITATDDLPPHMFNIMMAEQSHEAAANLPHLIGFVPRDPAITDRHRDAIQGITAMRGVYRWDDAGMPEAKARAALDRRPDIAERFLRTFPFLSLPETI